MNKAVNIASDRLKPIFTEAAERIEGPENIPTPQNR